MVPYVATGIVRVEGESPAYEPMLPGIVGVSDLLGAAARRLEQMARRPFVPVMVPGGYTENMVAPGFHRYQRMSSEICRIGEPGCTHENVIDAITAIGVHPNQLRRFVPGETFRASD